jgi:hypothetical protein
VATLELDHRPPSHETVAADLMPSRCDPKICDRTRKSTDLDIAEIQRLPIPIRSRWFQSVLVTEAHRFFGTTRRVARAVGMGAGADKLASVDDQIFVADWPTLKPAL